jgi:hypothetical protein
MVGCGAQLFADREMESALARLAVDAIELHGKRAAPPAPPPVKGKEKSIKG